MAAPADQAYAGGNAVAGLSEAAAAGVQELGEAKSRVWWAASTVQLRGGCIRNAQSQMRSGACPHHLAVKTLAGTLLNCFPAPPGLNLAGSKVHAWRVTFMSIPLALLY